jgi:hypothetical protein
MGQDQVQACIPPLKLVLSQLKNTSQREPPIELFGLCISAAYNSFRTSGIVQRFAVVVSFYGT